MVIGVLTNSRVVKGVATQHNGVSGCWVTQCGHHLSLIRWHLSRDFKGREHPRWRRKTNLRRKNKIPSEDGIFRIQWGNGYFYLHSKVVLWCRWLRTAWESEVVSIWPWSPLYLFNGSSWFATRLGCAKANTKISFHFLSKQQLAVHLGVASSPSELGEEKNHPRAHIFQGKRGGISGFEGGGGCTFQTSRQGHCYLSCFPSPRLPHPFSHWILLYVPQKEHLILVPHLPHHSRSWIAGASCPARLISPPSSLNTWLIKIKTTFPSLLCFWCSHVTQFWPMRCGAEVIHAVSGLSSCRWGACPPLSLFSLHPDWKVGMLAGSWIIRWKHVLRI